MFHDQIPTQEGVMQRPPEAGLQQSCQLVEKYLQEGTSQLRNQGEGNSGRRKSSNCLLDAFLRLREAL